MSNKSVKIQNEYIKSFEFEVNEKSKSRDSDNTNESTL
jgi:hypothetical protein